MTELEQTQSPGVFVIPPRLVDRADGVHGHYCVERSRDGVCHEFWNERAGEWCSAGTVYIGRVQAEKKLFDLRAALREGMRHV